MLVISQKKGEKLRIGRDITITILESKAGKVRLGIEAPQELEVMRESLYRERQQQGMQQGKNPTAASPKSEAPTANSPTSDAPTAEVPAAAPDSKQPDSPESSRAHAPASAGLASCSDSAQPA